MLKELRSIGLEAGEIINSIYSGAFSVIQKSDLSPLTEADLKANKFIESQLKILTPEIPIISEEAELPDFSLRKNWSRFWLVDPLDGTKEFVKKIPEFTVNIALIEGGLPILAVLYAPALKLLYFAGQREGAWKQSDLSEPVRIFSKKPDPGQPLTIVESRSHPSKELEDYLAGSGVKVLNRLGMGSSLKFCLVAEGTADIYPRFGPTMEWDVAAGDCIFRNSGRNGPRVSPLTYNKIDLKNSNFILGKD